MKTRLKRGAVVLAAVLLSSLTPLASSGAPDSTRAPLVRLGGRGAQASLATPRSAAQGFFSAARATRYSDAAKFLDLSEVPESERAKRAPLLARELKVVLDQHLWVDLESLSEQPEGDLKDGLPPDRDRVGVIQTDRGAFAINLSRTVAADGRGEWRFTAGTVERAGILYSETGYARVLSWLPEWATGMRLGNVEGWQWLALLLLTAIGVILSRLVTRSIYAGVRALTRRTEPEFRNRMLESVRPPVQMVSALAVVSLGATYLRLSVPAKRTLGHIGVALLVALVAWTLMRLVDLAISRTLAKLQAEGRRSGVSTLVLMRRVLKGVIVVVAVLALLQNLGFNVSGLLAGFGIAGAAIAFAAQKSIESLFAGLLLSADEPVRIGDFCRFGNQQGIVEDIGLRSTRIRTLDRTVVSVPNSELAAVHIENFAARDRIRLLTTLNLRYETTQAQITSVLDGLRELLAADKRVSPKDLRVRFVSFGAYSLNIEVMAYILTIDYPTFLSIQEELFLGFMTVVSQNGTDFAFPSQTLYMARDAMSDAGKPATTPAP
jgi:MscS family membrane protein